MNLSENTVLLSKWIDDASRICTVCHTNPDGDALGSSAAVFFYLTECRGKSVTTLLPDAPSQSVEFILDGVNYLSGGRQAVDAISACDLLICLDFNVLSRTESLRDACTSFAGRKVLIDHHVGPEAEAFDLCFSDTGVSSASELLYEILMRMPGVDGDARRLPARTAYALMAGMTTDTNNFANSVFPGTLRMASALLEAGVDREDILCRLYSSGREERLRAQGDILRDRLVITPEGAAIIVLTADVLRSYALLDGETEGFVNIPLEVKEVRLSIFAREEDGRFRVSLRS
ncbi:MAG: DHH family phosphoesterase, partial [Bacteroidales bacterium]|nr:DHH family phosphoesterase [Bacteroidales bacterium]